MEELSLELPAMYGDHHVIEVRRILFDIPGVEDVYASSAFQVAEVSFNPEKVDKETITAMLEKAGYTGDLSIHKETSDKTFNPESGNKAFFRHTSSLEQTDHVISFTQEVNPANRALWPCPGMEPIKSMD